jgi:inhibitor of cysteine peptidase
MVTHVELTAEDRGREIRLQRNETLVITLDANPSTGYHWETSEIDPGVLELTDDTFEPHRNRALRVGAAGTQRLTFEPVADGTIHLSLAYRRPWEAEVEPANTFTVHITVAATDETVVDEC